MRSAPLVSAIIPTYNRANLVGEAIESVLGQTYPHVEVIVVDDGSTDDTVVRLAQFGNRIRVVAQDNAGPAAARNRGIAMCNGQFVAFLDSDDLWVRTKLDRQVALLQRLPASIPCCLSNIMMRWANRQVTSFELSWLNPAIDEGIWLNPDEVLATRFVLFNQAVMIRRSVLERVGGFDEGLRLLEDTDLAMRLSLEGVWAFIREPLSIWRETAGSCYQEAQRAKIGPREALVTVLDKNLSKLSEWDHNKGLRKCLTAALKRARRELRAAQLAQRPAWGMSTAGILLQRMERYRRAALRRSPWFPQMRVQDLQAWTSQLINRDGAAPWSY